MTKELINAFKRVSSEENILFSIVEASLAAPDGEVREVVFCSVHEAVVAAGGAKVRQDGPSGRHQPPTPARRHLIKNAAQDGTTVSVSAIARQAGADRNSLYRYRDLVALVHAAEVRHADQDPAGSSPVSRASLQADLANAQARNTRLTTRIQQLERRLS